jgi:hypothetical protein
LLPLCPLSMSQSQSLPKLSYLCTISPHLSSISIKGVFLIDVKASIWVDGWHLNLYFLCWNDTTCRVLEIPHIGSLTLILISGTPPPMS